MVSSSKLRWAIGQEASRIILNGHTWIYTTKACICAFGTSLEFDRIMKAQHWKRRASVCFGAFLFFCSSVSARFLLLRLLLTFPVSKLFCTTWLASIAHHRSKCMRLANSSKTWGFYKPNEFDSIDTTGSHTKTLKFPLSWQGTASTFLKSLNSKAVLDRIKIWQDIILLSNIREKMGEEKTCRFLHVD